MTQQLTTDEIRTLNMLVSHYKTAIAKAQMAQEMEAEFVERLRAKYALGPEWVCNDLLEGFVKADGGSQHDENN